MIPPLLTLPVLSLLATLFLGLIIFFNNPQQRINRTLSLLIFFGFLWILTVFMADMSRNLNTALFWTKMAVIGPSFIPPLLLYFSLIFPSQERRISLWRMIIVFSPIAIFLILAPTKFNTERVFFKSWGTDFVPGILYNMLFVYFFAYFSLAFKNFLFSYKKTIGIEKIQILYVFLGFFSAVIIGIIFNLILPLFGFTEFTTIGPAFSIMAFSGFTTYAILKHYLMQIRVVATEILVFLATIVLTVEAINSSSITGLIFRLGFLIFFILIGFLLIRSVLNEIRYREELKKAYDELKVLDKAKSEFVSMASHQLRTPLSAIKGYISMLIEGSYGEIPKEAKERLRNVFYSNERLIQIVNDLLNISRIELGKMEVEKSETQIEDLVQSCYDELKLEADKKKLKMAFIQPKKPLPKIMVDQLKIRQVFMNLIDNAIRYTKKGKIEIRAKEEDSLIKVSVKDSGVGLDAQELGVIFEGFNRGSAGINFFVEGAGLGLFVAKKFLELHQGKIRAESEGREKGSTFIVELPIK